MPGETILGKKEGNKDLESLMHSDTFNNNNDSSDDKHHSDFNQVGVPENAQNQVDQGGNSENPVEKTRKSASYPWFFLNH